MIHVMGDIDDCLFPWSDEIHARSHAAGLHDNTEPWKTWHPWEDYGCTAGAWWAVVNQALEDGMYEHARPIPGSVLGWNRLYWELHGMAGLHLVTARGFGSNMDGAQKIREATPIWVEEYGIAHDTLTFAKDKVAAQAELGVRFDYAIDDGVHNYEALDADGVKVYLLSRPHNAGHPGRRVETIDEFVDIILKEIA